MSAKSEQVENQEELQEQPTSFKAELFSWIKVLLVATIIGLSISYVIKPTIVSGLSMYPTLDNGDYLMMNRLAYKVGDPERNDIVVFNTEFNSVFIKRVIGVAGDTVKVQNGKVWVNGKELKEDYINGEFHVGDIETTVPEGHLFVMGDNRDNSLDSRFQEVGFVNEDDVMGTVFVELYPSPSIPK